MNSSLELIENLKKRGIKNEQVLNVMQQIPRERFIDEALSHLAYSGDALPIGFKQTISQPYTVARMIEIILGFNKGRSYQLRKKNKINKILEIGTGSGYQTAILANIFDSVFTIERIHGLFRKAKLNLKPFTLENIAFRWEDGNIGWQEFAQFDAIIISAATPVIATTLFDQLRLGGVLLAPVGESKNNQDLQLVIKDIDGLSTCIVDNAKFVPLLSGVQ